jgi:hypothetical protein
VQPNADGTQGYNAYAYANGNPATLTDPGGHAAGLAELGQAIASVFFWIAAILDWALFGEGRYEREHGGGGIGEWPGGISGGELGGDGDAGSELDPSNWPRLPRVGIGTDDTPDFLDRRTGPAGRGGIGGGSAWSPKGATWEELQAFSDIIYPALETAGYPGARVVLRGSRWHGITRNPHGITPTTDWNRGIVDPKLFQAARNLGYPTKGAANKPENWRTFPLSAGQMSDIGVRGLPSKWGQGHYDRGGPIQGDSTYVVYNDLRFLIGKDGGYYELARPGEI